MLEIQLYKRIQCKSDDFNICSEHKIILSLRRTSEVDKNNKVNNIIEYEKNYEDYIIIYKREFLSPNEDL